MRLEDWVDTIPYLILIVLGFVGAAHADREQSEAS